MKETIMSTPFQRAEQLFFRSLNSVVEPAVRSGLLSPRLTPSTLIVLESTGFKSGQQRRTPLWSIGLGKYRLVSTFRGDRSFWVKNLQKQPEAAFYLGGKRYDTQSVVFAPGVKFDADGLPLAVQGLTKLFTRAADRGMAVALLLP